MGRLALALFVVALIDISSALADPKARPNLQQSSLTLLERALAERESDKVARPVGSCIYFCGDQVVEAERCPDGDCPAFDCHSRSNTCETKPRS